jgi:hypothetical protein
MMARDYVLEQILKDGAPLTLEKYLRISVIPQKKSARKFWQKFLR